MKYALFREKVKKYPYFRSNIFPHLTKDIATLRPQLREWIQKGYVHKLKRGLYTLNEDDRLAGLSRYYLANQLYFPSYISNETAMSYYGFIPEAVYTITSVTTKKTQTFINYLGKFHYRHIQTTCFDDFIAEKDEFGNTFYIATKEFNVLEIVNLDVHLEVFVNII